MTPVNAGHGWRHPKETGRAVSLASTCQHAQMVLI